MSRLTKNNYCQASMRDMCEWLTTNRLPTGQCRCPLCDKLLLLRKNHRGWRTIFPTHTPAKPSLEKNS